MNLDYLAFLSFMVATGLYWFMGPGGPLHAIDVQSPFRAQIDDASRANSVLLWLVGAPTAVFAVLFMISEGLFGGAAMLLFGTAALFYSFGREDYLTLTQRVLARARAGDSAGAASVIDAIESDGEAHDDAEFCGEASIFFSKMAMQRWFGPVSYFFLMGPAGAVAYRLAHETQGTAFSVSESVMRVIEWLPSRLMAPSCAVFGDYDKTLGHVVQKGPSLQPSTAEFFEDAVDAALEGDKTELAVYERLSGLFRLLDRSFLLWLGIFALFVLV